MSAKCVSHASVVIPTKNGMPLIEQSLRAILDQAAPWPFEVVVIDSGSTDGTWELVQSLPVVSTRIRPEEFSHGGTRNRGASLARGSFIVFLVQDAVPADRHWLRRLVEAADAPGVAGSYCRQLNWPSDNSLVRLHWQRSLGQPLHRVVQQLGPGQCWERLAPSERLAIATFRDTGSCIRREVWEEFPFQGAYGEDLEWATRVIRAGHALVYEPDSCVYHSHDRSGAYELRRAYADHELIMRLCGYRLFPHLENAVRSWIVSSVEAVRVIGADRASVTRKMLLALRALSVVGAWHLGIWLGARAGQGESPRLWRHVDRVMRRGV